MQKTQVIVHQPDVEAFLAIAQRFGAVEFTPVAANESLQGVQSVAPNAALLARVQHATQFLNTYEVKRSLWKTLREGSVTDYTEAQVARQLHDTDAITMIVSDAQAIQVELAEKNSVVTRLKQQRALLKTWSVVGNRLSELDTDQTVSFLVQKPAEVKGGLVPMLDAALAQSGSTCATESYANATLVTVVRTDSKAVIAAITEVGLELVTRPEGVEAASVELTRVEEQLAAAVAEQGGVHDQAAHTAHTHLHQLRIAGEILQWEQNRFATLAEAKQTESTVVLEGWLRSDKQAEIEEAVKVAGVVALLTEIELTADEVPPVEIANNSFIRPFEAVTRLYGMPGHTDLDPTLFLAGFFFLFFGLSLTDVGYGATLVVISGGLLMFAKLRDGVRSMMKLLFYIGIATMLVGMLFGGYFGIAPELLPAPLQALQQFDPIGNPLPVFYLALGLGVFQVMVGMLLKIYSEHRNGRLVDGIWEQGPWLLLFVVGIVYVLNMFEYASVPTETLVRVAYVGLGLMLVGAIRASDSVLSGLMNIGGSLYGSVGYLSDILSYSRLLALGLATTALAFAVNLIAGIVYDTNQILGPVFAVIILLIGHTFTLAVNTLGAFIHSARLQFVEFFGKFVVGSGRSFAPLARSDNHVTVTKE